MNTSAKKDLRAEGLAQLNKYRSKRGKKGGSGTQSPAVEKKEAKKEAKEDESKQAAQTSARNSPIPQTPARSPAAPPAQDPVKETPVSPRVPPVSPTVPMPAYTPATHSTQSFQIQPTSTETAQKLKMLQQTNSLLGTQNQALTNQVRDLEMRIRQLEADLQNLSLNLRTSEESRNNALSEIQDIKERHVAELAEYKEKETELNKMKASLLSLQSKFDDEVRLRQSNQTLHEEELMPLRGQLKLLELEKKQAEREKAGAEFQLKEATQMNTQLNNNAVELNKRIALLESQLSSSNAKLNQIINSQGPTERDLRAKELEIERLTTNHNSEIQRLNAYCKQLELENVALNSQRNELLGKVKQGEDTLEKEIENVRMEYQDMASNYDQQARVIEKLMAQKRCIMQQLTREVERNGTLVKENLEAKQTISLQQQLLQNTSAFQEAPVSRDITLSLTGPKVGIPSGRSSTTNTPTKTRTNGKATEYSTSQNKTEVAANALAVVKVGNGSGVQLPPMDMNQVKPIPAPAPKGWLASIPLLGRLWTPKTPVEQTLPTVVL